MTFPYGGGWNTATARAVRTRGRAILAAGLGIQLIAVLLVVDQSPSIAFASGFWWILIAIIEGWILTKGIKSYHSHDSVSGGLIQLPLCGTMLFCGSGFAIVTVVTGAAFWYWGSRIYESGNPPEK